MVAFPVVLGTFSELLDTNLYCSFVEDWELMELQLLMPGGAPVQGVQHVDDF